MKINFTQIIIDYKCIFFFPLDHKMMKSWSNMKQYVSFVNGTPLRITFKLQNGAHTLPQVCHVIKLTDL